MGHLCDIGHKGSDDPIVRSVIQARSLPQHVGDRGMGQHR